MDYSNAVVSMARNVASLADIPWEQLADGTARGCLMEMAYAGADVSAYCNEDGTWYIRLMGASMTCAEWAAKFGV